MKQIKLKMWIFCLPWTVLNERTRLRNGALKATWCVDVDVNGGERWTNQETKRRKAFRNYFRYDQEMQDSVISWSVWVSEFIQEICFRKTFTQKTKKPQANFFEARFFVFWLFLQNAFRKHGYWQTAALKSVTVNDGKTQWRLWLSWRGKDCR